MAPRAWFRPFPGFQFDLAPRFQIDPAPRLQIKLISFIVFPVLMFSCGGLSFYFSLCFLPCPPLPFLTFPLRTFLTVRVSNQPCARFQIDPAPRLQIKLISFIVFPVLMFSCGGLSIYFPLCFLPCPPLPFLTFPLRTFPKVRVSNQPCARFPRLQGKRQPGGDPMNSMT